MKGRNVCWSLLYALLLVVLVTGFGHAEMYGGVKQKVRYREGELIVKYKDDVSEDGKVLSRHRHGSAKKRGFRDLRLEHVKLKQGQSVEEALKEYESDADVEYAEPDYVVETMNTPYDPQFPSLWGLAKINAPAAWDTSTGSSNVVVAIIDTGVDHNHGDLKANLWVNTAEVNGQSGVDDDGDGVVDDIYGYNAVANSGNPMDDNSHGTHVAGTIGAVGNNGIGVAGVNWNARIMACKFLGATGSGYTSDAIECLQYIKNMKARGVNIVATNNSWGGSGYSQALYDAISSQRDILFIAAAGNATANNDTTLTYPADYNLPNIIAVAATTSSDGLASFSNYGRRTVHVGAPGYSILSTVPNNAYGYKSGTSMATPHVTGLAALIKAKDMTSDWRGIKNLILSSGDPLPALAGKSVTGRRINAFGALTCLDSRAFSALKFPTTIQVGVPALLSALSINCGQPLGPVTVALSGGEVIMLHDDGVSPDPAAGDGVFTATYIPPRAYETFTFSSPAGSDTVSNIAPLAITTTLTSATLGTYYSKTLAASGGIKPYAWALTAGGLPPGLTLKASTGAISGTPTTAGAFNFTVQVKDARGTTATKPLAMSVVIGQLTISTSSLTGGAVGTNYSRALAAIGGVKPYAWSLTAGSLPPGLILNASTGGISGIPTKAGSYGFTIQVKDARGTTAAKTLTINII
ncbi:MAG: peptidase S8/S53 subtilisin kexin [Geobacteraceae bacterium]|nr:MAG: peptidase S8/S53 subtilisin kexin [Geobacteraceae bacterium]